MRGALFRPSHATASTAASLRRRFPAYTVLSPAHFRQAPAPSWAFADATASISSTKLNSKPHDAAATTATYELLLQRLYQVNRFTAVKLGVGNMNQLNAAFGDPTSRYDIVHVAGTNGKGSVSFKVAQVLQRSGYRTGLFVSPHVSSFRERIQINGELISEAQVCEHLSEIFNISAQLRIPATFFEITTMLAFRHFAKEQVDCVVLETGLGGRLDATNIVTPVVSVITSIGLDHTRILGNTIEEITREKAGIIKPNVPVIIGPQAPRDILQQHADSNQASLVQVPAESRFEDDFNAENTAIARQVCVQLNELAHNGAPHPLVVDLESPRVTSALESRPPCRFQVLHIVRPNSTEKKVTIVLDVAHNLPAMEKLMQSLRRRFPTQVPRFVCGFSADKDINKVLQTITSVYNHESDSTERIHSRIHLVKANNPRAASLEEINLSLVKAGGEPFNRISSIADGVDEAVAAARASIEDEVVVVCGSVFLMAEARQALGFKEPIDSPVVTAVAGSHLSTPESRLAAATANNS